MLKMAGRGEVNHKRVKSPGFFERSSSSRRTNLIFKLSTGLSVFAVAFFAAFFSSSHFMPISESSAETTNMSGTYYANITSSGLVDFNINATPDGIGKVGKDTLTIDTNATAGYKLYLSTPSSTPGNGLYLKDGASLDSNTKATASTGTLSDPAKLATNTWGYVPSRTTSSGTAQSYTDADADAVTGSSVFAGVPEYESEDIIYTNTSPSTSGTNTLDIYYGVNFSTALPSGTYTNTIVYTAIVDAINPSTLTDNISISPAYQEGLSAGTPITISTPLYFGFNLANLGNITVTIGGNACTNVAPGTGTSGNLTITCNSPAAANIGKYDVVVTIEKYNEIYTLTQGYEYKYPVCSASTAEGALCQNTAGDATTMIRLKDNNFWTKESQGTTTWNSTLSGVSCPAGTSKPTAAIFQTLLKAYGGVNATKWGLPYGTDASAGDLYDATGWPNYLWSTTEYDSGRAWLMSIYSSSSDFSGYGAKSASNQVVCYRAAMQSFSASTASGDTNGTEYSFMDIRDSKIYSAAKLADGNVWMTKDLQLDGGRTLTSAESDVSSNFTLAADNSGTWCTENSSACYNQSLMTKQNAPHGYLYNWYAATAGTGTYEISSGEVSASICPKGWKLPTKDQYVALDVAYGGSGSNRTDATQRDKFMAAPLSFNYTGYRGGATTSNTTGNAYYWSRTAYSNNSAYDLYFLANGSFYPQGSNYKSYGFAVRCVAN